MFSPVFILFYNNWCEPTAVLEKTLANIRRSRRQRGKNRRCRGENVNFWNSQLLNCADGLRSVETEDVFKKFFGGKGRRRAFEEQAATFFSPTHFFATFLFWSHNSATFFFYRLLYPPPIWPVGLLFELVLICAWHDCCVSTSSFVSVWLTKLGVICMTVLQLINTRR